MQSSISESIFEFAVALSGAARVFTINQIARHPHLSWRTKPQKRARECLRPYHESFEKMPGSVNQPVIWRLSNKERRRRGIVDAKISGATQRREHWLGLGDIWCALTFAGGRPEKWITEWNRQFDVFCVWNDQPWLIEYQRTPITTKKWEEKWANRKEWFKSKEWDVKPRVVLVNVTNQEDSTVRVPGGTIHVRSIEELPRALRRSIQ